MRDVLLALFVFGTIPFIVMRPYLGLLVWSWLGYMNPNRLCYGFAYNFPWVELIAIVTLLAFFFSKESKRIPLSTASVLLMLFLVWTGLTTYFAVMPKQAWSEWQEFAKILVMVFVTLAMVNNRERMHWLVWTIVASLGFYGLKGGLFTILSGGGSHVFGPAASFIADNNDLAQAFCMTLPLMRYLQLQTSRKQIRTGLWILMLLTGVAILGTYSRGGLITLAAVSLALLLKSRRRVAIIIVVAALGFTAYQFMPAKWTARMDTLHHAAETESAQTRIQSWEFAANVALHRPLTGGGFEIYKSARLWAEYAPDGSTRRAIHSIYFRILGEQGFPGIIIFLSLLLVSWRNCSRVRKRTRGNPEMKWAFDLASMLQVSLLAFMIAGMATTSSYFDLSYQLVAMCALLSAIVATKLAGSEIEPKKMVLPDNFTDLNQSPQGINRRIAR